MKLAHKYDNIAVTLHWLIAIAFILMLLSGLTMVNLDITRALKFSLYQWHKSLGIIALSLVLIRIIWRLTHKPPKLPMRINKLEKKLATLGHGALYFWMTLLPLSGWLIVSSSSYGIPTIVFGLFEWPHIPYVKADNNINDMASSSHVILAFSFIALLSLHVAAVIKHRIKEQENLIKRMWF